MTDVFLNPGDYFVGDHTHRVRTLLGSCVSITLWDPALRIGAMSHILLWKRPSRNQGLLDAHYADEALELMLHGLSQHSVPRQRLVAKLFGGADMFPSHGVGARTAVGRRNGEAAHRLLQDHGLVVQSKSLFGVGHRNIVFDVQSGHVWARQVRPADRTSP